MTPRKALRIARREVSKNAGKLDRRTAVLLAVVLLAAAALGPAVAERGTTVDRGIYRAAVAPDDPYYQPVSEDPTFAVVDPSTDAAVDAELLVRDGRVRVVDSRKGRAALAQFRTAVDEYNARLMAQEPDRAAAFPVAVTVVYAEQSGPSFADAGSGGSDAPTGGTAGGTGEGGASSGADDESGGADGGGADVEASDGGAPLPDGGGSGPFGGGEDVRDGTPADIAPPFPFESLVLAFAFVLPMNFVVQAYASSVIGERVNRRGELLLVAPVSRWDIVVGKTAPYLLAMLAIASATALLIGGGAVAVAAVVPLALVFLASGFVGGMFARSFKELTFVTVAASVALTSYVFIPAIFSDVHPIALISPLTLVVQELQGEAVSLGEYLFSTGPFYLAGGVLFALGAGVYREEDMFTQRPLHAKALDAVASRLRSRSSVAAWSVLFIPFVFAAELLAVATLFVFPPSLALPALFTVVAVVEEVAKSIHVYAGFERGTFDRSARSAAALGLFSGVGFFLGEKLTLAAQLVGLPELALGRAAFGAGLDASPTTVAALLLLPLGLHVSTATISALGARKGTTSYLAALAVAALCHLAYNLAVVSRLV